MMNWARRIRWRWAVLGSALWLILLSSISLQEGHPKLAQWTGAAAIAVAVLGALFAVLRLLTRLVLTGTRTLYRHISRNRRSSRTRHAVARRTPIRR